MRHALSRLVLAFGLVLGLSGAGSAHLTSQELLDEISGNTLTGFHSGGVNFSEYHAPDGRVFGFNNGEAVDGGCWRVRDDAICYYYPRGSITGDFCWRYARAGTDGYRIAHIGSDSRGLVRLKKGNPENLSDQGKSWTCDALLSQAKGRLYSLAPNRSSQSERF